MACFREPIAAMAARGWGVDVYTSYQAFHPIPYFDNPSIRLFFFGSTCFDYLKLVKKIIFRKPRYDWIVAVPQHSLYYAALAAKISGTKLACLSDEIYDSRQTAGRIEKKWKSREISAHQQCDFTIALDRVRADYVREVNQLGQAHPIFVVPNSLPGCSVRLQSRYYQDVLAIPESDKILLHIGSGWWKLDFSQINEVSRGWKNRTVLVFQSRYHDSILNGHDKMRINRNVLPYSFLGHAVSSAHIGLAMYKDTGVNMRLIGLSSGKIALCMKYSLPVITTRLPSLTWVEEEGCGVLVDDIAQTEAACEKILSNYEFYVQNVKNYYDRYLDFDKNFLPVLNRLEQ